VSHAVLAGATVAYERLRYGPEEHEWVVVSRNLRTGQVIRETPTGTEHRPGDIGVGPIISLAVKPDGSTAWVAENAERSTLAPNGTPAIRYFDIYADDHSGERLLAVGTNIDPSSLALGGTHLYWTEAGTPRSATIN
jgi:DNA-binding beta-propeller fold protein YncE